MAKDAFAFGLLRRKEVTIPSLRGWAVLLLLFVAGGLGFLKGIHPFLSPNHPIGGEILVVEGWIPDYCLREALQTFRGRGYKLLVTTGGPLPAGMPYSFLGSHAELAAKTLREMGLGADSVLAVPSIDAIKDRTYMEGVALKDWMQASGHACPSLDLFTFSAHARRSRLLYRNALGPGTEVGVYSARDRGYDPAVWWRSSNGVRRISDETIAYLYAVIFF